MTRSGIFIGFLAALLALPGCNQGGASKGTASAPPADMTPAQVVKAFLGAVRKQDDKRARILLSAVAREKTAKMELVQDLHVSDKAKFEVGQVEMVGDDGAHVACTWSDVDEDGETYSTNIVWIVGKDDDGWRICGMAMKVFDDQPPVVLNYEDPEDMKRKQSLIEQEIARRETEEVARQAKQPAESAGKAR